MHDFGRDFYGQELRVVALGFMRPELKFSGIPELVARIRADVGAAAALLDAPANAAAADDAWLRFE
jgi:riboflavin kinase